MAAPTPRPAGWKERERRQCEFFRCPQRINVLELSSRLRFFKAEQQICFKFGSRRRRAGGRNFPGIALHFPLEGLCVGAGDYGGGGGAAPAAPEAGVRGGVGRDEFFGFPPSGRGGKFPPGCGHGPAAPACRALPCPPLLSDVFNKRFMQEQTWDPLPARNWASANQSVILEEEIAKSLYFFF